MEQFKHARKTPEVQISVINLSIELILITPPSGISIPSARRPQGLTQVCAPQTNFKTMQCKGENDVLYSCSN